MKILITLNEMIQSREFIFKTENPTINTKYFISGKNILKRRESEELIQFEQRKEILCTLSNNAFNIY